MADYLHGAYGVISTAGTKVAAKSPNAIVYIGTAPVQTIAGGADNVNKPILVTDIAQARKALGYSEDWGKYTLCEAMHAHFELGGVGPLVLINVLDPERHKAAQGGTRSLKAENGRVVLTDMEDAVLASVKVAGKTAGKDYVAAYDQKKKTVTLTETDKGALGTDELEITYDLVDPSKVTEEDVVGATDGMGLNTGVYAVANVYQETGMIPSFLLAPGFSCMPEVHAAMQKAGSKVNGHWDVYMLCDIPIVDDGGEAVTLEGASAWKKKNGYACVNETVYFPLARGTDGKTYHLSTLAAANLQKLLIENDGIPYKTASNTACPIIANLYLGESAKGRVYDDRMINEALCKNGIASAAFTGGRWAIWGSHSADYDQSEEDDVNISETNRMMLYYISNDFQQRRTRNVDQPMTKNDIESIVAEEKARLDALVKIGALTYGTVTLSATEDRNSDMMRGDWTFAFEVTTTPLAKSLTALVNWTDEGFITYFN